MPLKLFGERKSKRRTIGVAAGKGGVGKSSITVNLALALKASGYKVGILDADLYGPSIRAMLPEDRLPLQKNERIIPALSNGIETISIAFFKDANQASIVRAPIANRLISQFLNQVEWGDLDYLLIDFPPGTGDIQITLSQQANLTGALIVTTPQEVALLDVRKCLDMFHQVNIPLIGLMENMSYYQNLETKEKIFLFGKEGGSRMAREWGMPFLGQVPIHPLICEYHDQGKSLFTNDSPALNELQNLFLHLAKEVHAHLDLLETSKQGMGTFELIWKEMK